MAPTFYETLRFSGRALDMSIFKPVPIDDVPDHALDEANEREFAG
jgi:hypothetical protein